jgi:hypothetical protein
MMRRIKAYPASSGLRRAGVRISEFRSDLAPSRPLDTSIIRESVIRDDEKTRPCPKAGYEFAQKVEVSKRIVRQTITKAGQHDKHPTPKYQFMTKSLLLLPWTVAVAVACNSF